MLKKEVRIKYTLQKCIVHLIDCKIGIKQEQSVNNDTKILANNLKMILA